MYSLEMRNRITMGKALSVCTSCTDSRIYIEDRIITNCMKIEELSHWIRRICMNRTSLCGICEGVLNEYNLKVVSSPLSVPCQACFKILEPHQTNKLIRMRMHMHVTTTITKCSILSRILSNTQQFTRVRVYFCIASVSFGCMKRMYRT